MTRANSRMRPPSAHGHLSRRSLLAALPAALLAPRLRAQAPPPIPVRGITHVALHAGNVRRSVDFYQALFGMPIQARVGSSVLLRVGEGPTFLSISPAGATPVRIARFGLGVTDFDPERVLRQLAAHGVTAGAAGGDTLAGGPMRARVVTRGDTRELYVADPEGVELQLQDATYCGGDGPLGATCGTPEPAPGPGLLAPRGFSHLTIFVGDAARENAFYQTAFGLDEQSSQGPGAPLLGVGPGDEFVMFAGGGGGRRGGGPPRPASIHHACMTVDDFDVEGILSTLEQAGVSRRPEGQIDTPPLISYVSLRMPNRGGAPGGTPELYFTDPDGLLMQLQDVRYCGGGGVLGETCS
jgi:catechol 2,3-dioxygenase-like lactoylglutathione lyase family enzyme